MATKKIRVYELARELGVENQVVLDLCERLKIGVKSHSSSIDDPLADRVRRLADSEGLRRDPIVEEEPPKPDSKKPDSRKPEPKKAAEPTAPAPEPESAPAPAPAVGGVAPDEPQVVAPVAPAIGEEAPEPIAPAPVHRVVRSTGVIPDPSLAPRPAPAPEPRPVERPAAAAAA